MSEYLQHYGVQGMRWGVRKKYSSYPGSYTKAGVNRFNESDAKYTKLKNSYKENKNTNSRYDNKMAKAKIRQAKSDMKKDYKHLKADKMGDKGKVRYANGERILNNNARAKFAMTVGSAVASGAVYLHQNKVLSDKAASIAAASGVAIFGAGVTDRIIQEHGNNQLRAYYAHTSNYK